MLAQREIYRPLSLLNQWEKEMERMLGRSVAEEESTVATSRWAPAVDIKEEDNRFVIYADIPGVDPKDIEIVVEKGMLSIRGERNAVKEDEEKAYKRTERLHGSFYRRFSLPDTADLDNISASGNHGVLEVSIPKQAETQARRITVQ